MNVQHAILSRARVYYGDGWLKMSGPLHHPLRAMLQNRHRLGRRVFIPDDTATRRSIGTSTTTTSRTLFTRSRTCTKPSARCRTMWPFGRTIPTHEKSEGSNAGGRRGRWTRCWRESKPRSEGEVMRRLDSAMLPDSVVFSRCRRSEVCERYTVTFALLHASILIAHLRGGSRTWTS